MMLPAVGVGGQVLAPVLEPTHRMTAAHREPAEADVLRQKNAFVSETAPDIRRNDTHLGVHQTQTLREAGSNDMGHLAARVQNQLVHAAIPIGDGAPPLDRRHALASGGNLASDFDRRIEGGADIDVDESLEKGVVAPVLVQKRRARQTRRQHVVDCRQLLEIDLDACRDIFGFGPGPAHAYGDQLPDLPHLLAGKHGLLGRFESREGGHSDNRLNAEEVCSRERLVAMLLRNVDRAKLCVGERRADEGNVSHARQADIAHILTAPAQKAIILLTLNRGADALIAHHYPFPGRGLRQDRTAALRSTRKAPLAG